MDGAWVAFLKELGINTSLMSVLVLVFSLVPIEGAGGQYQRLRQGLLGLAFGACAVLAMQFPLTVAPGVLIDGRAVVQALAGAFLPPAGALLALLMAAAYRAWLGGIGAPTGVVILVLVTGAGMLWRRQYMARAGEGRLAAWLLALGVATSAIALLVSLALPGGLGFKLFPRLVVPVPLVYIVGILLFGSLLDIVRSRQLALHALRQREIALAQSRLHFQTIYETTPDAMGVLRLRDAVLLEVNSAFESISGYSRDEVIGRAPQALGLWHDEPTRLGVRQQLLDGAGCINSLELDLLRRDGTRMWGLLSTRPIRTDGQSCVLFILRDLTERRRVESETRREHEARRVAEAASRAKTEFLSRMSHELRTPLNAVLGFAQLLVADQAAPLSQQQRARMDVIQQAGWHLLDLINDVLHLTSIESGKLPLHLRAVDLHVLAGEAIDILRPQAMKAEVSLELDALPPDVPLAWADAMRTRQILLNLVSNGIKYNRSGGWVRLALLAGADSPQVTVTDSGMGMTPLQLQHLFEPFNRLGREQSKVEGTGIGMSLARTLALAMGGEIAVSSEPGRGTCVTLSLPAAGALEHAASQQRGDAQEQVPSAAQWPLQGRVLLIEDNEVNQLVVEGMLRDLSGLELRTAATGAEGLRLAREWLPQVILLDLGLPDMDGLQVLAQLRADPACQGLHIAVLSASALPEDLECARRAGADDYWVKPVHMASFRVKLLAALAGKAEAST